MHFLKQNKLIFFIIACSSLLFSPSLFNFFSADDWFHLRISQVENFQEFLSFFSFIKNDQSASFYRPLPTQVFFFLSQKLFGLQPFFYHVLTLLTFIFSLFLVYKISFKLNLNKNQSILTLFFYAISATHFTRLYFLSAFQEILMFVFLLLSWITFLKSQKILPIIFFILALLSKETAIVFPFILLFYLTLTKQNNIKRLLPYFFIFFIYLILRLYFFKTPLGDSYGFDFTLKKLFNTYFWYTLWSFGTPEFLVDYVSSNLKIVPRFFDVLPIWSNILLINISITIISFLSLLFNQIKKLSSLFLGFLIFIIGLLPVAFLPWHKFTLELTLPLLGFCLLLSKLITNSKSKILNLTFLSSFIILNFITNYLYFKTSYVITRAVISKKVYLYFIEKNPSLENNIVFVNNGESSKDWGLSKQVALSTSNSDMFRVLYKNPTLKIYFEDLDKNFPENNIKIDSLQFLK